MTTKVRLSYLHPGRKGLFIFKCTTCFPGQGCTDLPEDEPRRQNLVPVGIQGGQRWELLFSYMDVYLSRLSMETEMRRYRMSKMRKIYQASLSCGPSSEAMEREASFWDG